MNIRAPRINRNRAGFGALVDRVIVRIYKKHGAVLCKATGEALIRELIKELGEETKRRGRCAVPHLGALYIRHTKARRVMNPVTRESMTLPAMWAIALRGSKFLKGVEGGG